jgi:hypothetical protein
MSAAQKALDQYARLISSLVACYNDESLQLEVQVSKVMDL